ncbi:DUF7519 family protein [Halobaculum sp. D14]|uniref:DUF7519 family protein n=1 Tax=unclassified Halobaculum TaxID=2640896 RepID=UPI003EB9D040
MTVTRSPPALGVAVAALPAAVGTASVALVAPAAGAVAAVGFLLVVVGTRGSSRRVLGWGAVGLALGVLAAGTVGGAGAAPLLVGALGTVLAWDLGEHAVGVGEQLGAETDATRTIGFHAAASVTVGAVGAAVAFGVYSTATGGQPLVALFFLLAGAVALVSALR